jgi:protein SDA1
MAAALSSRAGTTAGVGSAGAVGSSGGVAVIERLAQLQNLIKRDPEGYADEFRLQHRAFAAELAIFQLNPRSNPEAFKALVTFLAHVAPCYRTELAGFPGQLFGLLGDRADALAGDVRRTLVTALILLRNRGLLEPLPLFAALTPLFRVKDKFLRDLVSTHIVADIKAHATSHHHHHKGGHGGGGGSGAGSTGGASTKGLQAHLFSLVGDEHAGTAKRGLDILIELYRRRVWTDARTVNVIAGALTSERTKLLVTALKFFLGPGSGDAAANAGGDSDSDAGDDDDDDDDEGGGGTGKTPYSLSNVSAKELRAARNMHQHAKSTRKRERQIARRVTALKKARSKNDPTAAPVFPAVQLLHDPQGLAERMFGSLRGGKQRFEVRLLQMNLVSRLIGTHRLLVLPFYSYCQKYLAAHQAAVTQVLVCLIQVRTRGRQTVARGGGSCVKRPAVHSVAHLAFLTPPPPSPLPPPLSRNPSTLPSLLCVAGVPRAGAAGRGHARADDHCQRVCV